MLKEFMSVLIWSLEGYYQGVCYINPWLGLTKVLHNQKIVFCKHKKFLLDILQQHEDGFY